MTYSSPQDGLPEYIGSMTILPDSPGIAEYISVNFELKYADGDHDPDIALETDPIFQALVDHMKSFSLSGWSTDSIGGSKSWTRGQGCESTP